MLEGEILPRNLSENMFINLASTTLWKAFHINYVLVGYSVLPHFSHDKQMAGHISRVHRSRLVCGVGGGLGEAPPCILFYQSALSLPPSPVGRLKSAASSLIYYRGNHCDKFVWGSLCCWRKHCHCASLCPLLSLLLIYYIVADVSWFELRSLEQSGGRRKAWQARILTAFEGIDKERGSSASVVYQLIAGM